MLFINWFDDILRKLIIWFFGLNILKHPWFGMIIVAVSFPIIIILLANSLIFEEIIEIRNRRKEEQKEVEENSPWWTLKKYGGWK